MEYTYEEITIEQETILKRIDENGQEWFIPIDLTNSDYQAYLNRDKLKVQHLTQIIADET
jgi:hypothetical protein